MVKDRLKFTPLNSKNLKEGFIFMYKNIMERTVSLLLAFSFILSMFPITVLAEETDTRTVIEETINNDSQTTHTVTFNAGTRATFDNVVVNDGEAINKPYEGGYKVDGWSIPGWFTEPELENVYTFGNPVTTDLNLYAKWNGTAYIYTYDLTNDTQNTNTCGTVSMTGYSGKYYNHALGSCAENEEYTATANPAEGYKFKEWRIGSQNATSAGTESTYTFKLTDSSSIVLYAVSSITDICVTLGMQASILPPGLSTLVTYSIVRRGLCRCSRTSPKMM